MPEQQHFAYIDEFGHSHQVEFRINEYDSLMILLFDQHGVEWGDCKGRAWCGTCHIEMLEGEVSEVMDREERITLSKLHNKTKTSRLACQIPADKNMIGIKFRILKDA